MQSNKDKMAALQFVKEKSVLVHRKEIERGIRETP
jgi:hypothetical protein